MNTAVFEVRKKEYVINEATYTFYEDGRVIGKSGQEIKQRPNEDGYACFTAGKKGHRRRTRTHRMIASLFVENPKGLPEVDHLDCNRMNAAANNLEWVSHQENIARAKEKGNYRGRYEGEKNPKAKLSEETVRLIRKDYENGLTQTQISNKYNVPWSTVHNIVNYLTWKSVD